MAVSLISYPVQIISGKMANLFPGFSPVEIEFKREDIQIISVSAGADNKILITVLAADVFGLIFPGEGLYLYAEGNTYTYDLSAKLITQTPGSPNWTFLIDAEFIEAAASGYMNFRQDWYLECKLVNEDNNSLLEYPALIQNDGTPSGIIKVNTSRMVDFLKNEILSTSQEVTNARKKCKLMYREVYRIHDTEVFVLLDDVPIIIVYAADEISPEKFLNKFEIPKMWAGYPFLINLAHSLENTTDSGIDVKFDELDINKDNLTLNNHLISFDVNKFGFLQSNFNDNIKTIEDNTRYIQFNAQTRSLIDYEDADYESTDYITS
jgi:hypothetical protein